MTDTTKPGFKSAADLPDEVRGHLGDLLLSLADNKRILGIRYSDWLLGAPSVEAGIACSAMAQDEWGHARIVYSMLKDFGHDPSQLEHERPSSEYRNSRLIDSDMESWPQVLALNFLLDTAISVQFEMLADSRFEPIHYKVRKLLDEERFHFDHAHGWSTRFLETKGGRAALEEAFGRAWNACMCWFGPDDDPLTESLAASGVVSGASRAARARWIERVAPIASELGLVGAGAALPPDGWIASEPDWTGWSAERRRAEEGGPDEDTLARARGDRNRSLLAD